MVSGLMVDHSKREPLLLKGTSKAAFTIQRALKTSHKETKTVTFLQIEHMPEGDKYSYLEISKDAIKRTYLFDPLSFKFFVDKNQCETLWHGCKEPSLLRIMRYAESLHTQKTKKGKQ